MFRPPTRGEAESKVQPAPAHDETQDAYKQHLPRLRGAQRGGGVCYVIGPARTAFCRRTAIHPPREAAPPVRRREVFQRFSSTACARPNSALRQTRIEGLVLSACTQCLSKCPPPEVIRPPEPHCAPEAQDRNSSTHMPKQRAHEQERVRQEAEEQP